MKNAVVFEHFSYAYPRTEAVLNNIDLVVPKSSFTVITGPSGAGKSTLCRAIAGVVPNYYGGRAAGRVLVDGEDTLGQRIADLTQYVGLVLDDYESQLVSLTVEEEIQFGLYNRGIMPDEALQLTSDALAQVGLAGKERLRLDELSGGQRQRLAIAAVLAYKPDVLVLDEAASALDPEGAESLYRMLDELRRLCGLTVIVVEHELGYVLPYATQVLALVDGRVAACGSMEETFSALWKEEALQMLVPELWQVKFTMEAAQGCRFGEWRTAEQAAAVLETAMKKGETGDNDQCRAG